MAKTCPKDLVRLLVEGTLDVTGTGSPAADERVDAVLGHLDTCSSCRKLRARLESQEKRLRVAIGAFGDGFRAIDSKTPSPDADECPSPGDLASFAEGALEGDALEALQDHVARCPLCRSAAVTATAPVMVEVRDEALAAARRRLAVVRAASAPAAEVRRTPSGRRRGMKTGRYAPVTVMPQKATSHWGAAVLIAAAACVVVSIGLIAFQAPTGPTTTETGEGVQTAKAAPVAPARETARPATPITPAPAGRERPTSVEPVRSGPEVSAPDAVVARNDALGADTSANEPEEDPGIDQPEAPRGIAPANTTPSSEGSTAAPARGDAAAPQPARGAPAGRPASRPAAPASPQPTALACAVSGISGTVEIRTKEAPSWRPLVTTDLVREGDALRARGLDSGLTFASRARVIFDGDSVATVSYTDNGVKIALESGGVEGEALARNGLQVWNSHGTVTVWQGGKVRVEAAAEGLRVCVDAGRAKVENPHGTAMVRPGRESFVTRDKKPHPEATLRGPRRTPRPSHGR